MTCVVIPFASVKTSRTFPISSQRQLQEEPESDGKPMTHEELADRAPTKVFRDFADTPGVKIRIKHDNGAEVS